MSANRRRQRLRAVLIAVMAPVLQSCGDDVDPGAGPASAVPQPLHGAGFVDVAEQAGLDFRHRNGMSGRYYFCETMGSGGALFDYDHDGDLDVFLVQGHALPGAAPDPSPAIDRLFRNDLDAHGGGLRFTDVTADSGLRSGGYGMGVATGDFDGDGWTDLYVTNFGPNQLWRNNGDGSFSDATATAGVGDSRWSVSASFLDFDRDGWLDLYVVNYVDFTLTTHKPCRTVSGALDYCSPLAYRPQADRLYRNSGDGSFEDVSMKSGIGQARASGLGVASGDFDGDGWLDLYVANDGMENHLWLNQGDGTFRDDAPFGGSAVNAAGQPEASMGVVVADLDGDGDEDLFLTHLDGETHTLYSNEGRGSFVDRSRGAALTTPSLAFTGFGTVALDYDRDGRLDLLTVNGAVRTLEHLAAAGDPYPLHQANQLFRNLGEGRFEETTGQAGEVFRLSEVSRGAALGDVDNDGDEDVLITNNAGPARLLLNQATGSWLGLELVQAGGRSGSRHALGTEVEILLPNGRTLRRRSRTDGSYASASDPRIAVALDSGIAGVTVQVRWLGGEAERWQLETLNRYVTLRRGEGAPAE